MTDLRAAATKALEWIDSGYISDSEAAFYIGEELRAALAEVSESGASRRELSAAKAFSSGRSDISERMEEADVHGPSRMTQRTEGSEA